jgi:hypothetical protein
MFYNHRIFIVLKIPRKRKYLITSKTAFTGGSKPGPESAAGLGTSCTNEEPCVISIQNEYSHTLNLPSQTTLQDDVLDNFHFPHKGPKLLHSSLPTMAHYGKTPVLRFPETMTVGQKITPEIQSQDELPVQQFCNFIPASTGLQSYTTMPRPRFESNFAGTRSSITGFHPDVTWPDSSELQCCIDDSQSTTFQSTVAFPPSNLNSFQSYVPGSRLNPITFPSDDVDSWSNSTEYDGTADSHFDETSVQSNFVQDILNYFPRRPNVPSNIESRNMDCDVRNIYNPIMDIINTQQRPQTLMPLYISRQTPDGNVVYYTLPPHPTTPSLYNMATADCRVFVPIERLGCGNENTGSVHGPGSSTMVWEEERESFLLEDSSDFWPPEETSSSPSQYYDSQGASTHPRPTLTAASDNAEYDDNANFTIDENQFVASIKEEKRSCRFLGSSQGTTSINSPYDRQCYHHFDRPAGPSSCAHDPFIPLQLSTSTTDEIGPACTIPLAYQTPIVHTNPPTPPTPPANLTTPGDTADWPLITKVEGSPILVSLSQTGAASNNTITAVHNSPPIGQNLECHGESSECSDLVNQPLTREERKRKFLSAFGFTSFEKSPSSACKLRDAGKEKTVPPNEAERIESVQSVSYDPSSSTIGENVSGSTAGSGMDEIGAFSPSVVKAATILTNSKLQRWKTMRKLNPSSKRSLSESLNETSTVPSSKTSCDAGRRHCEDSNRSEKVTSGKESGGQNIMTSNGSSLQEPVDEERKEFTVVEESSTKRTVAIQVQSKNVKRLRRMRTHQHSAGSQTDEQMTSKNVAETKATSSLVSKPPGSSYQSQKSTATDNAKIPCKKQHTAVLARSNQAAVKTTPAIEKNLLTNARTDDSNFRCDEVTSADDVELDEKETKKKLNVQTNQHVGLTFIDDTKTFLKFQAEPWRSLTCF